MKLNTLYFEPQSGYVVMNTGEAILSWYFGSYNNRLSGCVVYPKDYFGGTAYGDKMKEMDKKLNIDTQPTIYQLIEATFEGGVKKK